MKYKCEVQANEEVINGQQQKFREIKGCSKIMKIDGCKKAVPEKERWIDKLEKIQKGKRDRKTGWKKGKRKER